MVLRRRLALRRRLVLLRRLRRWSLAVLLWLVLRWLVLRWLVRLVARRARVDLLDEL